MLRKLAGQYTSLTNSFIAYLILVALITPLVTFLGFTWDKTILFNGLEELLLCGLVLWAGLVLLFDNKPSDLRFFRQPIFLVAAAFGLYAVGHLLLSDVEVYSMAGLVINLRFIAILFVGAVVGIKNQRSLARLLPALVYLGVFVAIVAQFITLLPESSLVTIGYDGIGSDQIGAPSAVHYVSDSLKLERLQGTLRSPNSLGAYLLIPVSILLFGSSVRIGKKWKVFFLIVLITGIILTYSRSAWIGLACIALFYAVNFYRKRYSQKPILTVAIVTTTLLIVLLSLPLITKTNLGQSLIFHQSTSDVGGSTETRISIYKSSLQKIVDQPLGNGSGYANAGSRLAEPGQRLDSPENIYLQIGFELGVIGLGLFLWLLYLVLQQCLKFTSEMRAIWLPLFSAFVIIGLFLPIWAEEVVTITWWGLLGVTLGASQTKRSVK